MLLTVAVMLFVGLGKVLSHSTQTQGRAQTAAVLTSPTLTLTSAATPKVRKHARKARVTVAPTPVLATPTGPCAAGDVAVTPSIASAIAGSDVTITLNLQTLTNPACTWDVGPASLAVRITSGADFIWSTQQCPAAIPAQNVVVRQAVQTQISLTWNGKRSDQDCSKYTLWAYPGYYHVAAAALGGNRADVQFKLQRPSPQTVYITKIAHPHKHSKARHPVATPSAH